MTNILAIKSENKYKLECNNHADSKEVCAGISALCYMLAGMLLNNPSADELIYDLTSGHAKITCWSDDVRVDEDFRCCVLGLLQIKESHPEEITITQNIIEI